MSGIHLWPDISQKNRSEEEIMKMTFTLIVCLLAAIVTFACGGEKKEESAMGKQSPVQIQQGTPAGDFSWETLPPFPGAVSTRARMAPGNRGYAKFEIRIFTSQEKARKIIDFYKQEMPEEWIFAEETELDNGLQGKWESSTTESTLWVRVTKSRPEADSQIEIIYGKKE
jgi:hypothetical protein